MAAIKAVVPEAAPATTATRAKIRWDKEGMIIYTVPGTMKKGRPGHVLTVLCRREQEGETPALHFVERGVYSCTGRQ